MCQFRGLTCKPAGPGVPWAPAALMSGNQGLGSDAVPGFADRVHSSWHQSTNLGPSPRNLEHRQRRRLSVSEVSRTGDRGRFQEIQSFVTRGRVGGFVDWPWMRRFRGLPCKAGGLGASATRRRRINTLATARLQVSWTRSGHPPASLRNLRRSPRNLRHRQRQGLVAFPVKDDGYAG